MTLFLFYNSFKEKIKDLLLKNNIREVDQAFNLIKELINETDTSYPMLDTIDDIARFDRNPDQLMVKLLYVLSYMYKNDDFWVKIFTLVYEFLYYYLIKMTNVYEKREKMIPYLIIFVIFHTKDHTLLLAIGWE